MAVRPPAEGDRAGLRRRVVRRDWLGIALLTVALAAAALLLVMAIEARAAPKGARWGADYFPNVTVTGHDGKKYRFYDDLILDKIVVVNFIYTRCGDICPLATARMAELYRRLGARMGKDIFIYSISIDPEHDTPERLAAYAEAFGAGPGWLFLTGASGDIAVIRHKLGERSRVLGQHRSEPMLGNDRTGEWTRFSAFEDPELSVHTVLSMDPTYRGTSTAIADYAAAPVASLAGTPGQGLFQKACASCHSIGEGDRIGPDLAGVTARRDPDWLKRFIAEPDAMRKQGDPLALELVAKYKGVLMPAVGLSEVDVKDLLAYIEARSGQVTAAQTGGEAPAP